MKNPEIPTSEINRLSSEYPGIALQGSDVERRYRDNPESGLSESEIAETSDSLATEAIRSFLENRATKELEQDDDVEKVEQSRAIHGVVRGPQQSFGLATMAPEAGFAQRTMSLPGTSAKTIMATTEASKEAPIEPIEKSELIGKDKTITLEVDGREIILKSVEFKNGKEYTYEYDDLGREISCETYKMVDGKRVKVHSKETIFGTKRNKDGEFFGYNAYDPNHPYPHIARSFMESGRFNGGTATIETDYDTSDEVIVSEQISGEMIERGKKAKQEIITIDRDKEGHLKINGHRIQEYVQVKEHGGRRLIRSGGMELSTDLSPDSRKLAYLLAENAAKGYKR
ncbi:MAG TPA: hypothetical protein VMR16_00455 [Candidatus Saccharimonadales bacterium]|nr:hypothetical protein [Candidatus Saccharimonadales bacterium]